MTDPPRLLDEGADDFELDVLRSASSDAAPASSLAAAMSAVTQATGAATAGAGAAAGASATLAVKGLLAIAIVSGTIVGYALLGRPSSSTLSSTPSVSARDTSRDVPSRLTEAIPQPLATSAELPSASVHAPDPPILRDAPKRAPPRPSMSAPPVSAQIASLDRVRTALGSRDGALALRELDRHDHEYPGGVLGPEATALRIEALLVAGDRARANALADQFLRTPASRAHATRVRSLLESNP